MTEKLCPTCAKPLGTHRAWDSDTNKQYCSYFCLDKARASGPDARDAEIRRLRTQLAKARAVIEYYADEHRWFQVTNAMGVRCYAIEERRGGDKARWYLDTYPEEEK